MSEEATRRRVLAGAAGTFTVLAGCSQRGSDSPSETASGSGEEADSTDGAFQRLAMNGRDLVIELREDSEIDQVNVIAPDGSRVRAMSVATGQTRLSIELGVRYAPGTYEVTTTDGASASITLEPELVIEELGVGANNLDVMPDSLGTTEPYAATIVVRNRGPGTTAVQNLSFAGNVPNKTTEVLDTSKRSGIFNTEDGTGEREVIVVPANESVRLFSSTLPFFFGGQAQSCSSMPDESVVVVQVEGTVQSVVVEERFGVTYEPEPDEGCSVEIRGVSE